MNDEWKELYEKYEKRKRRIVNKILLASIIAAFSIAAIFYLSQNQDSESPLPSGASPENIYSALQKSASSGSYSFATNLSDTQCYWLRSTANENGFALEVREYNSPEKNCIGDFLNRTEIPLEKPINLMGNDCICGKKICELENVLEGNRTNLKIKGC